MKDIPIVEVKTTVTVKKTYTAFVDEDAIKKLIGAPSWAKVTIDGQYYTGDEFYGQLEVTWEVVSEGTDNE